PDLNGFVRSRRSRAGARAFRDPGHRSEQVIEATNNARLPESRRCGSAKTKTPRRSGVFKTDSTANILIRVGMSTPLSAEGNTLGNLGAQTKGRAMSNADWRY